MKDYNNHQFGLTGKFNSSFKDSDLVTNYGYILEYCPDHPYPHDKSNQTTRVLQHRLVVERNFEMFDEFYFEIINGNIILKPLYEVHHINENKQDNRVENLQIMSKAEHVSYHNSLKELQRNDTGQIIGVVKSSNNGESCDANPVIILEIS